MVISGHGDDSSVAPHTVIGVRMASDDDADSDDEDDLACLFAPQKSRPAGHTYDGLCLLTLYYVS